MRLLVTGAAGMLGQDVQKAAAAAGHDVIARSRAEVDITDASAVNAAVRSAAPDVIVNCAAWTNVDAAEGDEDGAEAVNGAGPAVLAQAAVEAGVWLVHVSTDYVFDGTKTSGPYVESDPVGPASVYGRTKLSGERAITRIARDRSTTARTAWLFGTGGPCFPATMLKLAAERDALSVVDDQRGCPTYTPHLAAALITLAEERVAGIVHLAAAGDCTWFQFASETIAAAGLTAVVSPCTTADFPRPAPRPAYSVLRSERGAAVPVLPHWRDGLSEYMAERAEARR